MRVLNIIVKSKREKRSVGSRGNDVIVPLRKEKGNNKVKIWLLLLHLVFFDLKAPRERTIIRRNTYAHPR